jgi:tRNA U54 and U55 pseudouridine synthase Pus10
MGQRTLAGADLSALRAGYDRKVHRTLPARAREAGDWPIRADHCFARVVLDAVFGDVWDDHVEGRPAYRHLSADELRAAIDIADRMLDGGRPVVVELNANSLRRRDADCRA